MGRRNPRPGRPENIRRVPMKRTPHCILVLLAVVLACQILPAQVDTGAILGTVKDQTGAVIPGAQVTITNVETGIAVSAATGADGTYEFRPVKIGTYTVTAERQGFRKVQQEN